MIVTLAGPPFLRAHGKNGQESCAAVGSYESGQQLQAVKFDYLFDEAASREELVAQHSICNAFAHFFPSSSWLP